MTGTQSFAALDGSASDHDGVANGVFTVDDGNLVVNGVVTCNDDGRGGNSACAMSFAVSGDMTVGSGGALYAENRTGAGDGGAITLTVGGNLALAGNAVISSAATSNSANANGGAINATVAGSVSVGAGSTIDSGSGAGEAGSITVAAGGVVTVDGNVLAGPSRTVAATRLTGAALTGGTGSQRGGQISISSTTFIEPALVVGAAANIVAQGETATGAVTLDGCGIDVRGLVASLSRGTAAAVVIRSGKDAVIDGRDLGAAGIRMGRVRADATAGTAAANRVDVFAADAVGIYGPATGHFAVSSNAGSNDPKGDGGSVVVIALAGTATAAGNAIDAGGSNSGNGGGSISLASAGDAVLSTATLRAAGDHTSRNNNRDGGSIAVRSYAGNVLWTDGVGDVRPLGSASSLPVADQGSIVLTACGTVNTTGSTFPVNGTATSVHPQTQTGVCSPEAPSLPPGTPPLVTCNTPPVANDAAASTNEDNSVTVTMTGTDADGDSLTFTIVSGPSNGVLGPVVPVNATTSTVLYTPNANYNGADSFVFQANDGNGGTDTATAAITIAPVNDPPAFLAGPSVSALEDGGPQTYANWASSIAAGPADESGQSVTFTVTNDDPSLFSVQPALAPDGTLTYTPAPNAYGTANLTVTAQDNGGTANGGNDTSAAQTSSITVTPVNDAPSFVKGADQTVNEDAGPQTVGGWATAVSAGPNEGSQTVSFVTTNDNDALFSSQPSVSSNGTLTYTPAANANGTATVTIHAQDDGGTANGGVDTSGSQTFTITVNAVNDAPSFTSGGNVSVLEDSGAYSAAWATNISAGPSDESGQTVSFSTSNDNNALFAVQPAVSASGVLSFTLNANLFGTATVTVTLSDGAGTANGGADTSAAQTFTITVQNVNDEPTFTPGGNVNRLEDSGAYSAAWATAISAGPNEIDNVAFAVTNTNNALFSAQPAISPSGVLTFAPAANAFGSATVTVTLSDDGGTANGGDDTSSSVTFTITIDSVNDAPGFTSGGNVSVAEDSGAYSASWATDISAGPANESSQTVAFVVTNDNNALFSGQPSVSPAGVLSFTPAANATGTATVTIHAQDNGGTANGGVDVSASQTFTITVSGVNDAPSFTPGANQTSNEDGGPRVVAGWATSISAGPADETGQTVSFSTSNDNNALFSAQPSISSDGTLTYTAAPDANGVATVTVYAQDDGGTANGGADTSASHTFTITIVAVNDAPSFTGGGDVTVDEDSAPYSAAWATAISAGAADEAGQALTFNVTSNNAALFASGPSISATGVLSFTLSANAFGSATITVTLSDDGGTANGGADTSASQTFTITANGVNDAPSFVAGGDVTVNEDSGPYAAAWASGISAGPNESGQIVAFSVSNDNNALFAVQPSISPTGVLTFTTALNAYGSATVTASLSDNGGTANGGVDTSAPVTFTITVTAVNDGPSANADSWETLGNTEIRVDLAAGLTPHVSDTTPSGNGARHNDSDPEGDPVVVTGVAGCSDTSAPFDCTLSGGAKVSMLANGSFSYTPAPGATSGSFQYTVTDVPSAGSPATSTGTVTFVIHDMIWYVNGSAAAGGNGTSSAPLVNFASINSVSDVDAPGHTIFVHTSNVSGGISLEAGQKLYGQGVGLSKPNNLNGNGAPTVLVAPGVNPTVTAPGDVVTVTGISGVEIAGLTLGSTGGNGIDVTSLPLGSAAGAAIFSNTIASAGAEGIDVNAGSSVSMNVVNISNTSIVSTGNGLDVSSVGTTAVSYSNGTISSAAGSGIVMNGGGSGLTVTALANITISGNTAGDGIRISNATFDANPGGAFNPVNAGTVMVGASGNGVGGEAVVLSNVSGDLSVATLNAFGGTAGVTVTGSGLFTGSAGMRIATGGGAIHASAGAGLAVTDATIGAGGLNFTSINAANAARGILLNNTGTTAGLTVTGSGTAASGGTIQNISGRGAAFINARGISLSFMNFISANTTDGANSDGGGNTDENGAIHLEQVTQVDLTGVNITTTAQHGINGNDVTDLDLTDVTISGTGNELWESGIYIFDLKGTPSAGRTSVFSNVDVSGSAQFNIFIGNAAGTNAPGGEKDRLELINDCDFSDSGTTSIGDHVSILNSGTGNFQVVVTGASFTSTVGGSYPGAHTADGIQVDASGSAQFDATIQTSTFTNAGQAGINLSASGNGQGTFAVLNNANVTVRSGNGINVSSAGPSSLSGTISGNTVSTNVATNAGVGISAVVDDNGSVTATISGNTVTASGANMFDYGVRAGARGGSGSANLTVRANTVQSAEVAGLWAFAGNGSAGETNTTCLNLSANTIDADSTAGFVDYFLEQYTGTTFRIQGLTGSGTDATNVANFVAATDNDSSPADPTVDVASGTTVNYGNGSCTTP